jgi:Raf kinase inhibitor-like YbhB/YbcL family protein
MRAGNTQKDGDKPMPMTATARLATLAVTLALGACASAPMSNIPGSFQMSSSAFADGTLMPAKFAGNTAGNANCVGQNISPPMTWTNVPEGTRSFALLMVDPEGRNGLGVDHWVAYGIPASVTGFAEGETTALGPKYVGGKGLAGVGHYLGPCTPAGVSYHHYTFTLIATDLEPGALPAGLTRPEVMARLVGHTKGSAGLVGLFGRAK